MLIASDDCFWFPLGPRGGEPFLASRLGEIRGATQDLKRYLRDAMGETGRSNMPSDSAMASVSIRTSTSSQTFPDFPRLSQTYVPRLLFVNVFFLVAVAKSPSLALATKEEQLQWEAASGCWYWMQWIWWTVYGCVWKCCVPLNPMVNDHYPY